MLERFNTFPVTHHHHPSFFSGSPPKSAGVIWLCNLALTKKWKGWWCTDILDSAHKILPALHVFEIDWIWFLRRSYPSESSPLKTSKAGHFIKLTLRLPSTAKASVCPLQKKIWRSDFPVFCAIKLTDELRRVLHRSKCKPLLAPSVELLAAIFERRR